MYKRKNRILFSQVGWFLLSLCGSLAYAETATITYTYDSLDRLTSLQIDDRVPVQYRYDDAGNILAVETKLFTLPDGTRINLNVLDKQTGEVLLFSGGVSPYLGAGGTVKVRDDLSGKRDWIEVPAAQVAWGSDGVKFNIYTAAGVDFEKLIKPVRIRLYDASGNVIFNGCYPFIDVCPSDWYAIAVVKLWKKDVIAGYGTQQEQGYFHPELPTKRVELLKAILEAVSDRAYPPPAKRPYEDVPFDTYYAGHVQYAKDHVIISGCNQAGTLFCPGDDVLRPDAAKIIVNTLLDAWPERYKVLFDRMKAGAPSEPLLGDVPTGSPYYPYVYTARESYFMGGFPDGNFHIDESLLRGAMAKAVCAAAYGALECLDKGYINFPVVASVTPGAAKFGVAQDFVVDGLKLPPSTVFYLENCPGSPGQTGALSPVTPTSVDADKLVFRCTPNTLGPQNGIIKDKPDGKPLFPFKVIVGSDAVITNFQPSSPHTVILERPATFVVEGTNLPDTMALFIEQCENIVAVPSDNIALQFTVRQYTCTPRFATGTKKVWIKDSPDGNVLSDTYTVEVVNGPVVTDVSPKQATIGESATFTVTGTGLSDALRMFITECVPNDHPITHKSATCCNIIYFREVSMGWVQQELGALSCAMSVGKSV